MPSCAMGFRIGNAMADGVRALVGTRKGLFILAGDEHRREWRIDSLALGGWAVYHAMVDPRDGVVYAAANHLVYGPTVQRSADDGATWTRSTRWSFPPDTDVKLDAAWHLTSGHASQPETLWLGGDPGLLFRSDDSGETWHANTGLLTHPTRESWIVSAGGLSLHSIQVDPADANRMFVAISAAGILRSTDAGETWTPINDGVLSAYPNPITYPDVGQCPHKLLLHPALFGRLWQQNHTGVYRSEDYGDSWTRVDPNGVPSDFGFPLMLDPADPDAAYVIPEKSYEFHWTDGGRLGVYKTRDAGKSWQLLDDGLPSPAWTAVLREASASDSQSVYFGTQSGSLFALTEGNQWVEAANHLPSILSVEVTSWPK